MLSTLCHSSHLKLRLSNTLQILARVYGQRSSERPQPGDSTVHLMSRPCHLVGFTLNLPPSAQLKTSLAAAAGKLPVGTSMLPLTWTLCLLHLQRVCGLLARQVYWTPGRSVPSPVYCPTSYFGDMKFSRLCHLHSWLKGFCRNREILFLDNFTLFLNHQNLLYRSVSI